MKHNILKFYKGVIIMRKVKMRINTENRASDSEILSNLDMFTFQYAINQIGTSALDFFQLGADEAMQKDKISIDFEINELLICYKKPLNEVVNRIIRLNKKFNDSRIKRIYANTFFKKTMLNLQMEAGTGYVYDLRKYKKGETRYICSLIDLLIYFKTNYDVIVPLFNKLPLEKEDITYIKATMTKLNNLNKVLEEEITSERHQFLTKKQKLKYNANIKFIIKNWKLNF